MRRVPVVWSIAAARAQPLWRRHRWLQSLGVLALYALASIVVFGRGVVGDMNGAIVGDGGADKTIALWGMEWLPHAVGALEDPLSSQAIWAPAGADLAWVTWSPAAAVAVMPISLTWGVVPAFNVLALAAPALAAWSAFLLLRELCGRAGVAVLGGALFGFSSFVTVHTIGHQHLALCFLIPLCALLVLRRLRRRDGRAAFVSLLAVALAVQLYVSTELALTLVATGATVMLIGFWQFTGTSREAFARTIVEASAAVVLAAVLASPLLIHAFVVTGTASQPVRSPYSQAADVANLVVPTRRTLLRPPGSEAVVERFTAGGAERVAYLGLPLVIAVIAFAFSPGGRTPRGRTLLIGTVVVMVAAMGPRLRIAGDTIAPAPWIVPGHLPVLDGLKPIRLMVYVALLTSAALCLWLAAAPRSRVRWLVAGLAAIALIPNPAGHLWTSSVPRPGYFTGGGATREIADGDTVLVLPWGPAGWSLLWQAEDDFRYRLVGGHIGRRSTVREEKWDDVYRAVRGADRVTPRRLRAFLTAHGVDVIVVAPGTSAAANRTILSLGLHGEPVADATVYRLR